MAVPSFLPLLIQDKQCRFRTAHGAFTLQDKARLPGILKSQLGLTLPVQQKITLFILQIEQVSSGILLRQIEDVARAYQGWVLEFKAVKNRVLTLFCYVVIPIWPTSRFMIRCTAANALRFLIGHNRPSALLPSGFS